MLTKTKLFVKIPRDEWEGLKKNPNFAELIEMLEDQTDLEDAKQVGGKDITLQNYLKKRGIRSNS